MDNVTFEVINVNRYDVFEKNHMIEPILYLQAFSPRPSSTYQILNALATFISSYIRASKRVWQYSSIIISDATYRFYHELSTRLWSGLLLNKWRKAYLMPILVLCEIDWLSRPGEDFDENEPDPDGPLDFMSTWYMQPQHNT